MLRVLSFVVCVALTGATAWAQPPAAAGAVAKATHEQFLQVRNLVMRSLDKVPDEMLSFRATPDVRTFAQLFGHIADGQTLLCTAAKGEKPAMTQEYRRVPQRRRRWPPRFASQTSSATRCTPA